MSKAKQIIKLQSQVTQLENKIGDLEAQLAETAALKDRLDALHGIETAYQTQLENAKEQEQELQILRLQHDQDVKARSNVQLTLKLSKTKSERYQRKMVDMSKRLQQAEEEVQRLKAKEKDVDQAKRMMETAKVTEDKIAARLDKEAGELEMERQLRLKEMVLHRETQGLLEDERIKVDKAKAATKEVEKRVLLEQGKYTALQRELQQERQIKAVRVDELRVQREEIARLEEVVKKHERMYEIQKDEIFRWGVRYRRLRDAFRIVQKRLTDTMRELPKSQTNKGEMVSPADFGLEDIVREREEKLAMTNARDRLLGKVPPTRRRGKALPSVRGADGKEVDRSASAPASSFLTDYESASFTKNSWGLVEDEPTVTSTGYVTSGGGSSGYLSGGGGIALARSQRPADWREYLQDEATVRAVLEKDRADEEARFAADDEGTKKKFGRVKGPSARSKVPGSLFVGSGLGMKKDLTQATEGGSARQILDRILAGNPEVERLRKME